MLRIYNVTGADRVKRPQYLVSFFSDADSYLQPAMILLLPPALTSSQRLQGSVSPFPQYLPRIDVLCHSISITQITKLVFIINIYIHVSGSICLSICMVWSNFIFVSHSSLQSDVKWQVVRPTLRCGR